MDEQTTGRIRFSDGSKNGAIVGAIKEARARGLISVQVETGRRKGCNSADVQD